jgi:L1 cell adhesion molecule like protein
MFEDSTVQSDMKYWPFDVISDGGKPKIQVDYKGEQKTFFPEEISSMVLVKMKETAEAYNMLLLFLSSLRVPLMKSLQGRMSFVHLCNLLGFWACHRH